MDKPCFPTWQTFTPLYRPSSWLVREAAADGARLIVESVPIFIYLSRVPRSAAGPSNSSRGSTSGWAEWQLARSPQGRAVVVAMKKSIPGIPRRKRCLKKVGFRSGDNGFRGFLEGRFGADDRLGE